jgi:amyloid beta precursor protein binding protein 1
VVSPISSLTLKAIATYTWEHQVPLFYIHSLGFFSHFSICLPPSFPVVETHPDPTTTTELRLTNPWPELAALAKEKTDGLEKMNDHDHGHVPYVILLLYYLELWKQKNEGRVPATYREKQEFRKLVEGGARTENAEGGEENYEEAAKAVLKSLNPATLGRNVQEIFQAEECNTLTKDVCGPTRISSPRQNYTLIANKFYRSSRPDSGS